MSIIAMIPARIGSERLKKKNLINIDGKPLLHYAIDLAKNCGIFDGIYVNGDDDIFKEIAEKESVSYYSRPKHLGSASATSDEVVYDFLCYHKTDILCWLNSVSPLLDIEDLKGGISYFNEENLDSMIASQIQIGHANYNGKPLNYNKEEKFARTQDLQQVELFCYSFMAWNSNIFKTSFEEKGYGLMCGKFSTYPVSNLSAIKVKTIDDANLIDTIMKVRKNDSKLSDYKQI